MIWSQTGILNRIFTTVGHSRTPDGWIVFNELELHMQLLAITCFRLQVQYTYEQLGRGFHSLDVASVFPFNALTLLVGRQEGIWPVKKLGVGLLVVTL